MPSGSTGLNSRMAFFRGNVPIDECPTGRPLKRRCQLGKTGKRRPKADRPDVHRRQSQRKSGESLSQPKDSKPQFKDSESSQDDARRHNQPKDNLATMKQEPLSRASVQLQCPRTAGNRRHGRLVQEHGLSCSPTTGFQCPLHSGAEVLPAWRRGVVRSWTTISPGTSHVRTREDFGSYMALAEAVASTRVPATSI